MPFNFNLQGLVALGLFGAANAHMIMAHPVPFDVGELNNSPLKPDGSDFPCKQLGYKVTAMNTIPVESPVLLDFNGTAVHAGGSCQLAISMDKEPTKDSVFKVIQVFEGGCPVAEHSGGLTFNIPKEFPNVDRATFAWVWNNKIGVRETYMNCAPIKVTGGSDNQDYFKSLPDLTKANIGNGCTTEDNADLLIPNPGDFVMQSPDFKPGHLQGASCAAAASSANQVAAPGKVKNLAAFTPPAKDSNQISYIGGGGGSSGGSNGGSSSGGAATTSANDGMYTQTQPAATSSLAATSAALSSAASTSTAPVNGGASTFQTMTIPASSADTPAYPTLSPTDGQGVTGPSTGAAAPTGSTSSDGSASSGGTAGTCTTDGAVVCNGINQFGICDRGKVVWQAVAAGTTCSNGSIQKKRSISVHRAAHGVHRRRIF